MEEDFYAEFVECDARWRRKYQHLQDQHVQVIAHKNRTIYFLQAVLDAVLAAGGLVRTGRLVGDVIVLKS